MSESPRESVASDVASDATSDAASDAEQRAERLWLAGIVSLGFALRAVGTRFGLPHVYHPDEPIVVERARHMLRAGTLRPNVVSGFPEFCYPTLYVHAQALLFAITTAIAPDRAPLATQGLLYQVGRLCTAVLGAATIYVCYRAARSLRSGRAGLAAAACMALSLGHVEHSHYITTDIPSTLLLAVALALSARVLELDREASDSADSADASLARQLRQLLLYSAAAAGIGAAIKYNGGLAVLLPLGAALVVRGRLAAHPAATAAQIAAAAGSAFVVGMPWMVFDPRAVIDGVRFQWALYNRPDRWTWHHATDMGDVLRALAVKLSTPMTVAVSLVGAAGLWRGRALGAPAPWPVGARSHDGVGGWRAGLALCALPLVNLLLLAGVRHMFVRHAIPLLPFVAVFAGLGWVDLREALARRANHAGLRKLVLAAAALALFGWPAARSVWLDVQRLQEDTRTSAARWITTNVPANKRVCTDWYMPPISRQRYRVNKTWSLCDLGLARLSRRCDVLVASSKTYSRYFRERVPTTLSALHRGCYETLFERWPRLRRFERPGKPTIQIFATPK